MSSTIAPNKSRGPMDTLQGESPDVCSETKEEARHRLAELRARANEALERSREKVREYPLASLLLAAGVGVVIGMLVSRRRSTE